MLLTLHFALGAFGTALGPWTAGRSTYYTLAAGENCGFTGLETSSTQFPYRLTAAPNTAFYANSLACGLCYEVSCVGPWTGSSACCTATPNVTIMVTDQCPASSNQQWCSGDITHFDLSQEAFTVIANTGCGVISTRYRQVTCDISSNVQIIQKDGINEYWFAMFVMSLNGNGGVSLVELQDSAGSGWVSGTRQTYNAWVFQSNTGFVVPFSVRVTDQSSQVVTFTNVITAINAGQIITTSQQFSSPAGTTTPPTPRPTTNKPTPSPTITIPSTSKPTTNKPTPSPTITPPPSSTPTTNRPTPSPTITPPPTSSPTTYKPTASPKQQTTQSPTISPTSSPTKNPATLAPTASKPTTPAPTNKPTNAPTRSPTMPITTTPTPTNPTTSSPTTTTTTTSTLGPTQSRTTTHAPVAQGQTAGPTPAAQSTSTAAPTAPTSTRAPTPMGGIILTTMTPSSSPTKARQLGYQYTLNICATPATLPTAFNITCLLSELEQLVSSITPPGWITAAQDFQQGVNTTTQCGWVSVVMPQTIIPTQILTDSQFPTSLVIDFQSSSYSTLINRHCAVPSSATIQASVLLVEDCGTFWEIPALDCKTPLHSAAPLAAGFIGLIATTLAFLLL